MLLPTPVLHVIIDRDGVLNRENTKGWVTHPRDWEWERGSLEALRLLSSHGISLTIVTNQSCIGRGLIARERVDQLHAWLADQLAVVDIPLKGILVCPHAPREGCLCRKPKPGLVLDAVCGSGIPRKATILIGDDVRDIEAARAGGISSALVRTGKGAVAELSLTGSVPIFDNLLHAVGATLGQCHRIDWLGGSRVP